MSIDKRARPVIQGIPTYIPGKSVESIKAELGLDHITKMASNENPLGPAVSLSEIKDLDLESYPDSKYEPIMDDLAAQLQINPTQLILGNGSDEILQLLSLAFVNPKDEVVTADCTFSEYGFVGQLLDATLIKVPLRDNAYDLEGIANNVTEKTKLIFIANPNNPTGTIVGAAELQNMIDVVSKRAPNSVIVIDEAYCEYVQSKDYPDGISLTRQYKNVVVLRTFSKIYGLAGLRIGYGVGSEEMIHVLQKVKQPFTVNKVALKMAEKALTRHDHIRQSIEINEAGKIYLYAELEKMTLKAVPTEANFIYFETPYLAQDVYHHLILKGIIVRPMTFFGRDYGIRVTIGTQVQNEAFVKALKISLEEIENEGPH